MPDTAPYLRRTEYINPLRIHELFIPCPIYRQRREPGASRRVNWNAGDHLAFVRYVGPEAWEAIHPRSCVVRVPAFPTPRVSLVDASEREGGSGSGVYHLRCSSTCSEHCFVLYLLVNSCWLPLFLVMTPSIYFLLENYRGRVSAAGGLGGIGICTRSGWC